MGFMLFCYYIYIMKYQTVLLLLGLARSTKLRLKPDDGLVGTDEIGMANNEDMYAFSEMAAQGASVSATVKALRKSLADEE